jgi:ABC-type microcin C transport system permease subunit YejE
MTLGLTKDMNITSSAAVEVLMGLPVLYVIIVGSCKFCPHVVPLKW